MDYKNFEKNMASKLRNAEVYVDTDALIDAIHPLENRKRRGIIWFSFASLLIMAFIPYYLYFGNTNDVNSFSTVEKNIEFHTDRPTSTNDFGIIKNDDVIKTALPTEKGKFPIQKLNISTVNKSSQNITNIVFNKKSMISNSKIDRNEKLKINTKILLPSLPYSKINTLEIDKNTVLNTKNQPTVECPSFNGPKWIPSIGVHVGAFYPSKQLSNKNTEQSVIYEDRLTHEKSLEGLNGGIFLQVEHFKLPFYLKFGIDYSKLTEQLKLETSIIKMDTTQGIISITESENGDTLTVIRGDIIIEKTITSKSVTHYNIQMIDLPINLGYRFNMKYFNVALEPGVCINLLSKTQGKVLNEIDKVNVISDSNGFNRNLGLSYFGNIALEKPLNFGTLSLNFKYRYIPKDFSTTSIAQHYRFGGVNLGYRIGF